MILSTRCIISHASATNYILEYSIQNVQPITYSNDSDEHFLLPYFLFTLNNSEYDPIVGRIIGYCI